jgi:hypothetical protein
MDDDPKKLFPNLGTTNDLWNAALDAAINAIMNERDIPSTWRFSAIDAVRKCKRPT